MKIGFRTLIGRCLPPLLIAVILVIFVSANAFPSNDNVDMGMPDVMVLISMKGDDIASLAYPKLVSKEQVASDLARFSKESHWSIANVKITNDGGMQSGEVHPSTSVDFVRTDSGKYDTRSMDIAPIITAFKKSSIIQIVFMTSSTWQFSGVQNFEDGHVRIDLSGSPGSYQYRVHVKDHNFDKLILPIQEAAKQQKLETKRGGIGATYIILVILLALATAVTVFFITKQLTTKREPNSI